MSFMPRVQTSPRGANDEPYILVITRRVLFDQDLFHNIRNYIAEQRLAVLHPFLDSNFRF